MGNIFNYSGPVTHKTPKALISVTMNPNKPHSICIILFPVYWNIWIQASIPYFFHSFQRCALHCSIVKANLFFLLKKKKKKRKKERIKLRIVFPSSTPYECASWMNNLLFSTSKMRTILLVLSEKNISRFAKDRNVCCDVHWQNSKKRNEETKYNNFYLLICEMLVFRFDNTFHFKRDRQIFSEMSLAAPSPQVSLQNSLSTNIWKNANVACDFRKSSIRKLLEISSSTRLKYCTIL